MTGWFGSVYMILLILHSWLRWVVLIVGAGAVVSASRAEPRPADRGSLAFTIALDLQVTVGLVLYLVVSPLGLPLLRSAGEVMHQAQLRFWAIEHPVGMLTALVLAHVFRVLARRAPTEEGRRRRLLWGSVLPLVIILITVPWPAMQYGRPLFRM